MMLEDNKDICPNADFVAAYPLAEPVICNAPARERFKIYEDKAVRSRRWYIRGGNLALWCVISAAIFTVAEQLVFLPLDIVPPHILGGFFASAAFAGIALHVILYVAQTKSSWLRNRFAAERIRSINFQAFACALEARDKNDLAARVARFTHEKLALLDQEINAGSYLRNFSPENATRLHDWSSSNTVGQAPVAIGQGPDKALLEAVAVSYRKLRTEYQLNFATDELTHSDRSRRFLSEATDVVYMIGAISAFIALFLKLHFLEPYFPEFARSGPPIFDAIVVFSFIIGLCLAHYENVSLREETSDRFSEYVERLKKAEQRQCLRDEIRDVELSAMEELKDFCTAADKVSFRL